MIARHRLLVATVASAAIVGASTGVWAAARDRDATEAPLTALNPPAISEARDTAGEFSPGIRPGRVGDPAIEFPKNLDSLPQSPYDIVADTKSGHVWFLVTPNGSPTFLLYDYDPSTGSVSTFEIPSSPVNLFYGMDVDPRGHVLLGYGFLVIDFDPSSGTYRQHSLLTTAHEGSHRQFAGSIGAGWVTDIAASESHAYVSRANTNAVTEVNLETGGMRELPFPPTFGVPLDIAIAAEDLWLTNIVDVEEGPPSQTGVLRVSTGQFEVVTGKTMALDNDGAEVYAIAWPPDALVRMERDGPEPVSERSVPGLTAPTGSGGVAGDLLAVDGATMWLAGSGRVGSIARYDVASGAVRVYELPSVFSTRHRCPPPDPNRGDGCPAEVEVFPAPGGLAVASNGDLYFTDTQGSGRIGVIHVE